MTQTTSPYDTGEIELGGATRDLSAYAPGALIKTSTFRRPEAAPTEVLYLVRPLEPPIMGMPVWSPTPLPRAITADLGPSRPPFGEHGVHRRRTPGRSLAVAVGFLVALFVALALTGCDAS